MVTPADLPSRTSNAALDAEHPAPVARTRRDVVAQLARRIIVKGVLGISLPAAILTTSLPAANSRLSLTGAPAAALAVASTSMGLMGDAPLSAAALDEIAAAGVLSGSLDFGAPNPAPTRASTTDHRVNLRSGPGTKYTVLASLNRGTSVSVIGSQGSWYKVSTASGATGWILSTFLSVSGGAAPAAPPAAPAAAAPAAASSAAVTTRANLRKGPGTAFGSFGLMAKGSAVKLVARSGNWVQVRSPRGTLGWVHGDLLNVSSRALASLPVATNVPQAAAATSGAPAAQQAAIPSSGRGAIASRVALAQVGRRYVWGGASPRGFDCSGLVLYAYRAAGVSLPHNARAQFNTRYGARVNSIGALRAGDIVFFANTNGPGITHSALYVGNGRMVTANSPATGVTYSSINTRYWRSHFAGAIRPY